MKQSLTAAQHCIFSAAALTADSPVGFSATAGAWGPLQKPVHYLLLVRRERRTIKAAVFLANTHLAFNISLCFP